MIRPATPKDACAMRRIERLAGEQFYEVGLPNVAEDEPLPAETLAAYAIAERAWVAEEDGEPCGYLLVDEVDGAAHVEQVSVTPAYQGRGIGRALVNRAEQWARDTGLTSLTLTTFTDVPWNRPLYEHLGFRVLSEDEIGPELAMLREQETAQGFDSTTRVAMRRELRPPET